MAGKARRTTHRSSKGKKLYAVRDKKGQFKDIQTYERAHRADLAHKSKAERSKAARSKTARSKTARSKTARSKATPSKATRSKAARKRASK